MQDDDKLLTQYAQGGSQAAFGQLVARHLSLVYSTCLRELGSPPLAEDAAQVVFLLLARKAKTLRAGPSLAGWLYKAARFVAKDVRKQEGRRRLGEERVMSETTHKQEPFTPECPSIGSVEPFLNDALSALKAGEREAVLLRFIEGHTLAETGAALGLSEDAARMRVTRAIEKMRRHLTAHGAAVNGIVLTGLLASDAARPTPANAAAMTQATLQAISAGPTANVLLLSRGVYQTMKLIKVKLAALAAVVALGGAALPPLAHAISPHKTTPPLPAAQAAGAKTLFLQHTTPTDVLSLMHWNRPVNLPAGVTQIKPLPAQNALSVVATPAGLAKVREIVKILDIEPRQVQIKYAYAPASDADLKASGIDFQDAPQTEPGLKPLSVTSGAGDRASRFLEALTQRGTVTQGPVVTTTSDVQASISMSSTAPAQEVEFLTFAATPRINGDNSVTLTLHPIFTINNVRHEINIFRTVKSGETMVIVIPTAAPRTADKNLLLFVTPTVLAASPRGASAEAPANPATLALLPENVTTKFTLDKGQHAVYDLTLPKGASAVVLDMRRTGADVDNINCHLSFTNGHVPLSHGSASTLAREMFVSSTGLENRVAVQARLRKPKPLILDIHNQGGGCQCWLTAFQAAPAADPSHVEVPLSTSVPLFGNIVPEPMALGEGKMGRLQQNGVAYFLLPLKSGRYKSIVDFSTAGGKIIDLLGGIAFLDAKGLLLFDEEGTPATGDTSTEFDSDPVHHGVSRFTLKHNLLFLVQVTNPGGRASNGAPVNFTARILPDNAAPAEKQK